MYEQQCVFSSYHFICLCDTIHLLSVLSRPFSQFKYPCLSWSSIPAVFFVFFLNRTNGLQNSPHWSICWMQVHYHALSIFTVCRIFTLSCMLHGSAWCKALQRYSSARQSFKGLVSTFGNPRTNMYRSGQVKLPRSPWRDASSAPFGQFLHTSNEKHRKGLPRLSVFQLSASINARHCHLEFGCVACNHCWSGSDIHTYICACSFSFSTQKERFSAMFFVASSTFMDVDVTWHMMSAWHGMQYRETRVNWRMNVVTCVLHNYHIIHYYNQSESSLNIDHEEFRLLTLTQYSNALGFISTIASAYESLPTPTPRVAILPAAYSKEQWWNRWSLRCEEQKSVMEKHGENKKQNVQTWVQNQVRYDGMEHVGPEERHNDSEYSSNMKQIQVHKRSRFNNEFWKYLEAHNLPFSAGNPAESQKLLLKQRMSHDSDSSCDAPGLAVASEWNLHQQLGRTWDSPAMVPND